MASMLQGRLDGVPASAEVRDAQLVVRTHTDVVRLPVELVLHSALTPVRDTLVLELGLLAPRPSPSAARACTGARGTRGPYILTRAQWRARAADRAAARLTPVTLRLTLAPAQAADADAWRRDVHAHAFPQERKRILVIANPVGGQGNGKRVLDTQVVPLFRAAHCALTVFETRGRSDAFRYVHAMDVHEFDALVCVGGDGTLHEIVNGLAARTDAAAALAALPLVPVPCGSGNGAYVSLHGAHRFNVALACLSALKGATHAQELCVVTQDAALFRTRPIYPLTGHAQDGRTYVQYYSFLSQAIGLMADIDLGTERFRFLGDLRFSLGCAAARAAPCRAPAAVGADVRALRYGSVLDAHAAPAPLRLDAPLPEGDEGAWRRVDEPVSTLYGGKMPYVARSLMAFPYASAADGAMEILLQTQSSSFVQKLASVVDGERGEHVEHPGVHYFKVEAFRVTPHVPTHGHYLSIDGEMVPYGAFQVEVAPLRMMLASLDDDEWHAPILHPPAAQDDDAAT
ncbi:LCB4 [Malassezia furfur]|nr:LCB4 [Malassezia furfur]